MMRLTGVQLYIVLPDCQDEDIIRMVVVEL
jgi:hypothetical protein